jgi:hypothetical protein
MYTVRVITHNDFEKSTKFFNVQNATKYALATIDCIDVALVDTLTRSHGTATKTYSSGLGHSSSLLKERGQPSSFSPTGLPRFDHL